jgi:hypothetical protein
MSGQPEDSRSQNRGREETAKTCFCGQKHGTIGVDSLKHATGPPRPELAAKDGRHP